MKHGILSVFKKKRHHMLDDEPAEPFLPPPLRRFLRGVFAFFLTISCFAAIGTIIAGLQTPLYKASAYLDLGPHFTTDGLAPMTGTVKSLADVQRDIQSEIETITSDRQLRRLIDIEQLAREPEFIQLVENRNKPKSLLLNPIKDFFYPTPFRYDEIRDPVGIVLSVLRGRIEVSSQKEKPHVLKVSFTSADRGRATRLANVVVRNYLEMQQLVPRLMRIERLDEEVSQPEIVSSSFMDRVRAYPNRKVQMKAALAELRLDLAKQNATDVTQLETKEQQANEKRNDYRKDKSRTEAQLKNELQRTVREISTIPVRELPYESLRWLKNEQVSLIRQEQLNVAELGAGHPELKPLRAERDMINAAIKEAEESVRKAAAEKEESLRASIEAMRNAELIVQRETIITRNGRAIPEGFDSKPVSALPISARSVEAYASSRKRSANAPLANKFLPMGSVDAPLIIPRTLIMREAVADEKPLNTSVWMTVNLFMLLGLIAGLIATVFAMRDTSVEPEWNTILTLPTGKYAPA
jgi:uncharacterized protein involved in exopolysaccharide biosynthesis